MLYWSLKAEKQTNAKPEAIWRLWSDVSSWSTWDDGLDWVTLEGDFVVGAKGMLKPDDASALPFVITHVEKNKSFKDVSSLPLTRIEVSHQMSYDRRGKLVVSHQMNVKGLLAPLLWFVMRPDIKKGLPKSVATLVSIAEASS